MGKLKFFSFIMVIVVSSMASPVFAQLIETEVGSNGQGETFFSQYLFLDWDKANVLARYFWVKDAVKRGEFAIGPTFDLGPIIVKGNVGMTTNKQLILATLIVINPGGREVVYIFDNKSSAWREDPYEVYQKLWVSLSRRGTFQFRYEDLEVGWQHVFARIGLEGRYSLKGPVHLYIAPFYDFVRKNIGAQAGLRF